MDRTPVPAREACILEVLIQWLMVFLLHPERMEDNSPPEYAYHIGIVIAFFPLLLIIKIFILSFGNRESYMQYTAWMFTDISIGLLSSHQPLFSPVSGSGGSPEVTSRTVPVVAVIEPSFKPTAILAVLSRDNSIAVIRGFIKEPRNPKVRYHYLPHPFLVLGYTGRIRPRTPPWEPHPGIPKVKPGVEVNPKSEGVSLVLVKNSTRKTIKQQLELAVSLIMIQFANIKKRSTIIKACRSKAVNGIKKIATSGSLNLLQLMIRCLTPSSGDFWSFVANAVLQFKPL